MRSILLILSVLILQALPARAQDLPRAYIPGTADIAATQRTIQEKYVENGFELKLTDTSYHVQSFVIVFAPAEGDLLRIASKKEKLALKSSLHGAIRKSDQLMTVEEIRVEKDGKISKLPSLIYTITD